MEVTQDRGLHGDGAAARNIARSHTRCCLPALADLAHAGEDDLFDLRVLLFGDLPLLEPQAGLEQASRSGVSSSSSAVAACPIAERIQRNPEMIMVSNRHARSFRGFAFRRIATKLYGGQGP
jgi:hypothetical protein